MKESNESNISSFKQYIEEKKEEKQAYRKAFIHKSYKGRCPPFTTNFSSLFKFIEYILPLSRGGPDHPDSTI